MTRTAAVWTLCASLLLGLAGAPAMRAQDEKNEAAPQEKPTDYERSRYISPSRELGATYKFDENGRPMLNEKDAKAKAKAGEKPKKKKEGPRKNKSRKPGKRRPWEKKASKDEAKKAKPAKEEKPEAEEEKPAAEEEQAEEAGNVKPEAEEKNPAGPEAGASKAQPSEDASGGSGKTISTDQPAGEEKPEEGGE